MAALWREKAGSFLAVLPGYAQRDLHDFFAFSVAMTDEEALAHRAEMTTVFPSLPQSAGRALIALRAGLEGQPNRMVDRHRADTSRLVMVAGAPREVRIEAISRSGVDVEALDRALCYLADDMSDE